MKKKKLTIVIGIIVLLVLVGTGIVLHTNAVKTSTNSIKDIRLGAGKHCNGSVGCDCSGFKAITNGKEWQKSYCKRCGHHKRNHR